MTQWEYLIISCALDDKTWRPRYANGQDIPDWQKQDIPAYLNQQGKDGWELMHVEIATVFGAGRNGFIDIGLARYESKEAAYRLFFKRPLPD